jgi:phage terminase large subunit
MDPLTEQALLACLQLAKASNCPQDQVNNFLPLGYTPHKWQWKFHAQARAADHPDGPIEIGCGGARGPGKSHAIFAQSALDDAQRVAKLKILFIRKTAISAKESFGDLIDRILSNKLAHTLSNNVIEFANGSRILLGGFHTDDDIEKYIGVEYDLIVIEELNQLTEEKYEKLKGSLRTSKPNWRPRIYASFNPGGIGHNFVKAHFVLPYRLNTQTTTRFIPSTYLDNPSLNKEYTDYLLSLSGDLGRAWREGDFDLFAGQFFKEWSEKIHVVDPFYLPDDWARFCAFDYGLNHPLSLGWYAVSPDSQVFKYRQLHGSGMTYTQAAEEYTALTMPDENIQYITCDPALWAKKGENDDKLSGAEIFSRRVGELTGHQPRLIKADNGRVIGWGVVREYLRPYMGADDTVTAKLQVFSTCADTIKSAPEQVHDERVPEDMKKQNGDDSWDETRYALMSRPRPTHTPEEIEKREFELAMKRKTKRLSTTPRLRFIK